jgi:hypothetical protein
VRMLGARFGRHEPVGQYTSVLKKSRVAQGSPKSS